MVKKIIRKIIVFTLVCSMFCIASTVEATDYSTLFKDSKGAVKSVENAEDIVLSCNKDGAIEFTKVLSCKDFTIEMKSNSLNCKNVNITLTDANDNAVAITYSVKPSSGKLAETELVFNNAFCNFTENDKEPVVVSKDDAGKAFSGFPGGVKLTIGFVGVTGSCNLSLLRLNNQALGNRGKNIGDLTEPMIQLISPLETKQFAGENFNVPTFEAFDVYSDIAEKTVTVSTPSGEEYVSDKDGKIKDFKIEEYGRYRLTYYAEDTNGNSGESIYFVYVNDDVAPIIKVDKLGKKSYKVGSKVEVPGYKAEDNLETYCVDVILMLPNSEIRLLSHDENGEITSYTSNKEIYNESFIGGENSFCVEQEGEYIIRYVAYDEFFNKEVVELTFKAK